MKKRLIILSDLWGKEKAEWLNNYTEILEAEFEIKFYDCCELGEVDKSDYTEKNLHEQFVNGGIERAVESLISAEKDKVSILGFSIGGTIAWKFGIESDKIDSLICVSSTRLRYEIATPEAEITLYYGANDTNKPQDEWRKRMQLPYTVLDRKAHEFYTEAEIAKQISFQIIQDSKKNKWGSTEPKPYPHK